MNTITRFTKEQLIAKAKEQIEFIRRTQVTGAGREHVDMCGELFEIALASLDADPVGEVIEQKSGMMMDGLVISVKPTYRNIKGIHKMKMMPLGTKFYTAPPAPSGYVMVPKCLTAENGAKSVMIGEFSETKFINCPECFGDDECETCDGSGRIEISVPVSWTNIKAIWAKGVEHFAAAPKQETL